MYRACSSPRRRRSKNCVFWTAVATGSKTCGEPRTTSFVAASRLQVGERGCALKAFRTGFNLVPCGSSVFNRFQNSRPAWQIDGRRVLVHIYRKRYIRQMRAPQQKTVAQAWVVHTVAGVSLSLTSRKPWGGGPRQGRRCGHTCTRADASVPAPPPHTHLGEKKRRGAGKQRRFVVKPSQDFGIPYNDR